MTIDVSEPLQELCNRLGLAYHNVKRIEFRPDTIIADVYLLDDNGAKYVRETKLGEYEAAIEVHQFKVTT
jgi:hypothetical protein